LLAACASFIATADSISAERREGTLGLLLLAGLRNREVISGKLVAAGFTAFFALLGALPALSLALLWGGVTGAQIARTGLAIVSIFFVSLAVGLFVSARSTSQDEAFRGSAALVDTRVFWPGLLRAFLTLLSPV